MITLRDSCVARDDQSRPFTPPTSDRKCFQQPPQKEKKKKRKRNIPREPQPDSFFSVVTKHEKEPPLPVALASVTRNVAASHPATCASRPGHIDEETHPKELNQSQKKPAS